VVDSRIDDIRVRLAEIRQILENDEEIRRAQKHVDQTEEAHSVVLKILKRAESDVEQQKIKIKQAEGNLYSGNVKNPKELQDLQNEVAAHKRYLGTLEDRQLEAMLKEEEASDVNNLAIVEYKRITERLANQNQNLTTEQSELIKELQRYESEREAALVPLDANLLTLYDELRQQKRGLAVATVTEGACAACGTTLTPAQNQCARSTTEICTCPSCKRILYAN